MRTIGFTGTAKNTGKTTTALHVLELCTQARKTVALTSIGFDGENKDHITGLPKPRYFAPAGSIMATADGLLSVGTPHYEIIERTGIQTIMGEIVLARVTEAGQVVLAGPNRKKDLLKVIARFHDLQVDVAFIDGALNRLVPMSCTDGLILSTGASLNPEIPFLAEHAEAISRLFEYPLMPSNGDLDGGIYLHAPGRESAYFSSGSLLSEAAAGELIAEISSPLAELVIPGACDPALFELVLRECAVHLNSARVLFGSPLKLVASGSPILWKNVLQKAQAEGITIGYLEYIPLLMATVNPFFPRFNRYTFMYEPDSVDKNELLQSVRSRIETIPVMDIWQPPLPDILKILSI